MLRALKYQRVIQNDIFHVTSDIKPTEHSLIMVCGTQKHIQVVYKSFLDCLKNLILPLTTDIKVSKKFPKMADTVSL